MPFDPFQPDELPLVSAIHDDPRSDEPRLIYAAWLQSRGETELAEFIRIQCAEPYFALDKQGPENAKVSVNTWRIKFEDPERTAKAIQILNHLHPGDRFPDPRLWQEYRRGLPLYEVKLDDDSLDLSVDHICGLKSPLARYRIFLHTCKLSEWFTHPMLRFTDEFRVFPVLSMVGLEDVEFSDSDIELFAKSSLPDRLETIALSGRLTPEAQALARDILAPRVKVDYSY